jgi:hypothetical protein
LGRGECGSAGTRLLQPHDPPNILRFLAPNSIGAAGRPGNGVDPTWILRGGMDLDGAERRLDGTGPSCLHRLKGQKHEIFIAVFLTQCAPSDSLEHHRPLFDFLFTFAEPF